MADDLTLIVGDSQISGWTDVRVTRRIEACPNDFALGFTERYPGEANALIVQAGDPCTVAIGGDVVITGYVDRYVRSYNATSHTLQITGRGKTQDLVDCSAEYAGGQIAGTLLTIAQTLCKPYGITVSSLSGPGPQIPQFNLTLGETAFDIIERICRYAGLLVYEGTDGNLILATSQDSQAACGFEEGVNVQAAHVMSAMDQRFSEVVTYLLSMETVGDLGNGGNATATAKDPFVPRNRKLYQIVENGGNGRDVAVARGLWEVARRTGRAVNASVVTDSWRDSGGDLWAPNTLANVNLPGLKLTNRLWTLGEVTYRRDASGTTCEVLMMDPSAFKPEPILLQPEFQDIAPAPVVPNG